VCSWGLHDAAPLCQPRKADVAATANKKRPSCTLLQQARQWGGLGWVGLGWGGMAWLVKTMVARRGAVLVCRIQVPLSLIVLALHARQNVAADDMSPDSPSVLLPVCQFRHAAASGSMQRSRKLATPPASPPGHGRLGPDRACCSTGLYWPVLALEAAVARRVHCQPRAEIRPGPGLTCGAGTRRSYCLEAAHARSLHARMGLSTPPPPPPSTCCPARQSPQRQWQG